MFCAELDDLERAYSTALGLPLSYELTDDHLVLRGDHGELTFARAPQLDPATLVGRTWVLDSRLGSDGSATPAVGAGQLLLADDGTYSGTTGTCTFSGNYVIEGDQVTLTSGTLDEAACPDDTDGEPDPVFAALGSAFVPMIDGDTMTIIGSDGAGIVYVVEHPGE
jgi:heat shock protein HslJ